ncbi:hypothetical protein KIN20_016994 [Parelaphostrongylus tenuis]|uniref:Uncharacterized protein n=1 Tax=Parelaphostrongylus tenuis TaxID=148309 RepID=A0AAD5N5Y1_PARTN|nr:hypothetical protein KIN20_016994 [Parelaphostrongylus tenuis]
MPQPVQSPGFRFIGLSSLPRTEVVSGRGGGATASLEGPSDFINAGGLFIFEGKPRSGRPTKLSCENLIAALEDEPSSCARKSAAELDASHATMLTHLHQLNFDDKKLQ